MKHQQNFELKNFTSFKIGAKAKNVYFPENKEEFIELLNSLKNPIILGGMSNVLISSNGISQDVILTKNFNNFEIRDKKVYAQAGVTGALLANKVADLGLSGIEFMCGFPGTIGGIVTMNASAHNQSLADVFESALVFDIKTKQLKTFNKNDMNFSYRNSIIKREEYILLEAVLNLNIKPKEEIHMQMAQNKEFRKNKQPNLSKPNCGSVFKNPKDDSAGRLLEAVGAKDFCIGGAKVYEKHANFIINFDNATSEDVSLLMENMYNKVKEKFNIELIPEVEYIGQKSEKEEKIWNKLLKN